MIHVSREPYQPSDRWLKHAAHEQERAATFFSAKPGGRFDFKVFRDREVRHLLFDMFKGKCCYCESAIGPVADFALEHYRPKHAVVGLDGKSLGGGYWWLASSWENLYLSCQVCNRNKYNRFPVADESRRARNPSDDLGAEQPLILDPAAQIRNATSYSHPDGLVASAAGMQLEGPPADWAGKVYSGHDPAQITIDILELNRDALVRARKQTASRIIARCDQAGPPPDLSLEGIQNWFLGLVEPGGAYVALQRQLTTERDRPI